MSTHTSGAIVVGVTGPGQEPAALQFAAECARREDAEVVLAHAFHTAPPAAPPNALITYAAAADVAQWVVEEVAREFEELTGGGVAFRTAVSAGSPARVLTDLGLDARMIVVQHRRDHGLARVFVGSTAYGAAAHAVCPVVSVNPEWEPGAAGEVVVGVHEDAKPGLVIEAGFAWAATTGASVRVVHAWRLDAAYDDIITARVAQEWRDAAEGGPGVRDGRPPRALSRCSRRHRGTPPAAGRGAGGRLADGLDDRGGPPRVAPVGPGEAGIGGPDLPAGREESGDGRAGRRGPARRWT